MASRRKTKKDISLENYVHSENKRVNNPPVGLVSSATDNVAGSSKYAHDPHVDPHLSWAGKVEGSSFEVPKVSLHIHERIDPQRIAKSFIKKRSQPQQTSLFEDPYNELPLLKAVHFYQHEQDWSNRLVAGDSLLVMNSLLQKEGMAGKVQMVYIDPPYGIKYNSNFQPFLNKRDVKDNNDADIPAEPEMIQAFRDTWELGIHSYLSHLYNRLLLTRDLLNKTGSVFVQISDENLHFVTQILSELFGAENQVGIITFRKKNMPFGAKNIERMSDYLIWFAKDINSLKYRKLFQKQDVQGASRWVNAELADGSSIKLSSEQWRNHNILPKGARIFRHASLKPSGFNASQVFEIEFKGKTYKPPYRGSWTTTKEGMERLMSANRIVAENENLMYKLFLDDYPVTEINNLWTDTSGESQKIYVVQTNEKVIQRCLLMTTDPEDLVLDPTCGSGTTAVVAERWGRRWITCDTSRVAITLAKQRLMTAKYDYYELAHPPEGLRSGFNYKSVPHITLGSIANNVPPQSETLYDQPTVEKGKVRVSGPFTVEAVPSLRTKPFDGNEEKLKLSGTELARSGFTSNLYQWIDELKAAGIRATGGKLITFGTIEPSPGTKYLHAEAEMLTEKGEMQRAVISFGPDYGPIEQRQIEETIKEANKLKDKPEFIIFAAFHFDPEAAKDIDQINNSKSEFTLLKAQMSVDLLTHDLRKKRSSNQSYWLIGQPDVEVIKGEKDTYQVKVNGFDYYNPVTGEIESGSSKHIAMWMLDTDYDEQSILPEQIFFPMGDSKRDWTKLAKALNGTVDEDLLELFTGTTSKSFTAGENKKIAVKIIDNRGIESFVVKSL